MGIYDRDYYRDEPQGFSLDRLTGGRSIVITLIILNVAVFLLDALFARPTPVGYASSPGPASLFLGLYDEDLFKPWFWFRFVTYGFAHADARHILFNMLGLFFLGRSVESTLGSRTFLWMYLTALVSGSVLWMIGTRAVAEPQMLLGASGGVVATVVLFCFFYPHQRVLLMMVFPVPAWILGMIVIGGDLWGVLNRPPIAAGGNDIAFGVHLVGAAYAYLFYKTRWELSHLWPSGLGSISNPLRRRPKLRVHQPDTGADDALARKADEVLKKLHERGEASLTARERKILEDYSRSVKQRR